MSVQYLRYPILFENVADSDTTNGIGALADTLKCQIFQTVNTIPTLTLEYASQGSLSKEIKVGEIIMTDASPISLRQKFRIQEVSKTLDTITIQATHIASDFTNRVLTKDISLPNMSANQCFQALQTAMPPVEAISDIEFTSDITELANINYTVEQNTDMSAILMGADQIGDEPTQSMQALYKGNWSFDNYHFYFMKNPGHYTGEVIKAGRDIGTITNDENITSMYTGVFPYAKYTPTPKKPLPTDMSQVGESYDSQGTVQYLGAGALTTYNTPYPGHSVVGSVNNGDKLQITRKVDGSSDPQPMNGDDWYMLSDNSWVDANFITFDKTGDYVINAGNGQGHTTTSKDSKGIIYPETGTATVCIRTIHVYKSPFQGKNHYRIGVTFKNGDRLNYKHIAIDENGNKWYEVGIDEWVYGPHLTFDKANDVVYEPAKGKTYVKKGAVWYSKPGKATKKKIAAGYYTILGQATGSSDTYYRLSSTKWAKASDCSFSNRRTKLPQSPSNYVDNEASSSGHIELHDKPGGSAVSYTIPTGEQVQVLGTADSNGESWTQVTWQNHTGWVLSDSLDYSADTDVPPDWGSNSSSNDDTDDAELPAQQVFVTLPNNFIYAENWLGKEHQHLIAWDASSYWTPDNANTSGQPTAADIQQLQSLAQAYIKQNRIGQPDPSTTLTEGEVGRISHADLYDTIGVEYDQLGIQVTAQVTSTTWDALGHRYISKTIGSLPVSYDHVLLQTANQNSNSKFGMANHRIDADVDLTTKIHEALKQEGSDRLAAEKDIAKQIGIVTDDFNGLRGRINEFDQDLVDIDGQFKDVQSWIESGGSTVLQFVNESGTQTYKNPTEIRAMNDDGSYMRFNSLGLEYVDQWGNADAAIDSRGNVIASHLTADTIKALKVDAFELTGSLIASTDGGSMKVYVCAEPDWAYLLPDNGGLGIWVKSDNYESLISSGSIRIGNGNGQNYTIMRPTEITVNGNEVLHAGNFTDYTSKYCTTGEVKTIVRSMVKAKYRK